MNNKTKRLGIAFLGLAIVLVVLNVMIYSLGNNDSKTVGIHLKDGDEMIYTISRSHTDAKVLKEYLLELEEDGLLLLDYEDTAYGMYIKGMGSDKLLKEDPSASKYWVYESKNNKSCKEAGMCDSPDKLVIEDGDDFVFILKSFNE